MFNVTNREVKRQVFAGQSCPVAMIDTRSNGVETVYMAYRCMSYDAPYYVGTFKTDADAKAALGWERTMSPLAQNQKIEL